MREKGTPRPAWQTRSGRKRKKPLMAVTVKCAKTTDLFKQSAARDDDEESRERTRASERKVGCVMLGDVN